MRPEYYLQIYANCSKIDVLPKTMIAIWAQPKEIITAKMSVKTDFDCGSKLLKMTDLLNFNYNFRDVF